MIICFIPVTAQASGLLLNCCIFFKNIQESLHILSRISFKHSGTRYNHIGSGFNYIPYIGRGNSSVHLDTGGKSLFISQIPKFPDLAECIGNKLLSAKSGIDGHDENHIHLFKNTGQCRHGCCRI